MTQIRTDHVDTGAMLRWIDGEGSDRDRQAVDAHLVQCAVCAHELGALREASRTVNQVLEAVLDVEAPTAVPDVRPTRSREARVTPLRDRPHARRPLGTGWRIAASVALLLGALTAVPQLRALALEAWRTVTGTHAEVPEVRAEPVTREPEMRAIVELTPDDSLAVVFEAPQATGRVTVTAHDSATAIILSSDPRTALVVLPSRVRLSNRGSQADYQVVIPSTLRKLVVVVAGKGQPALTGSELRRIGRTIIPLQ